MTQPTGSPDRASQNPFDLSDTIVAVAMAAGRGALAIVRVAGPDAHTICRPLVSPWPESARRATLARVRDADGALLDEAIVIRFDAPHSFTGEHAVEFVSHGGAIVPVTIVRALVRAGARAAAPGEFTRRAVLNGRLDVLQAEAVGDLIGARSHAAQRVALQQLDGGLSRRILSLRDALIGLEALIAYDIDFPEEDDGPISPRRVADATRDVIASLESLLSTARLGELVREGALVVLAGAPNVGKSSLFNALLGQRRAIVTEVPGTTRDAIEAVLDGARIPIRLVDTAGLRDALDPVEKLGVEVSGSYLERADVVLACGDSTSALDAACAAARSRSSAPVIAVWTKADASAAPADLVDLVSNGYQFPVICTSAETAAGLGELVGAIERAMAVGAPADSEAPLLTQERHRVCVARALDEVRAFQAARDEGSLPATVAAVHLRAAAGGLEELIGVVDAEDVLDQVFRRFCVGK